MFFLFFFIVILAMAHSIEAEEEAVMRASTLANQVNCPLLLKGITSDTAADIVKVKKNRGNVLYAEVTPAALGQAHHMFSRFLNSRIHEILCLFFRGLQNVFFCYIGIFDPNRKPQPCRKTK